MRNKKQLPFTPLPQIAVLVDGETEFWYLQMIKRNEKAIKVAIKPEIPQHKKLSKQFEQVISLSKEYDKVIWMVDLDVILKDSTSSIKNKPKPFAQFLDYESKIRHKYRNVQIIINQPCLEYWLLIHFELRTPPFSNCNEAEQLLKKHLPEYLKTERYYTQKDKDIYLRLKTQLPNAVKNAQTLSAFDAENPNRGYTEMHKLFEAIGLKF